MYSSRALLMHPPRLRETEDRSWTGQQRDFLGKKLLLLHLRYTSNTEHPFVHYVKQNTYPIPPQTTFTLVSKPSASSASSSTSANSPNINSTQWQRVSCPAQPRVLFSAAPSRLLLRSATPSRLALSSRRRDYSMSLPEPCLSASPSALSEEGEFCSGHEPGLAM